MSVPLAETPSKGYKPPDESVPLAAYSPNRSMVAPVPHSGGRDVDVEGPIKTLVAGLDPKVAAEALARSDILGKLPPAQQTALRCALIAASESNKRADQIQLDLKRIRANLEEAENARKLEASDFLLKSVRTEQQMVSLRDELAVAIAAGEASDLRFRFRRMFCWLSLAVILCAGIVCAFIAARTAEPPATAVPSTAQGGSAGVPQTAPGTAAEQATPPMAPSGQAEFDRFNRDLARVPQREIDHVLERANRWLIALRYAPCSLQTTEGERSVLIGPNGQSQRPLTKTLQHCADGIEHVIE